MNLEDNKQAGTPRVGMEKATPDIPRLLYLGEVPVEASWHGSALLHRVLGGYPADRLRIIECGDAVSKPERRLPGVTYGHVPRGRLKRVTHTRWGHWANLAMVAAASRSGSTFAKAFWEDFRPEAILTVAHGTEWPRACQLARKLHIPYHLIVHDDWPECVSVPAMFRNWCRGLFGEVYRGAGSRLCVSGAMAAAYAQRYGAPGVTLPPVRAPGVNGYDAPPQPDAGRSGFTVGYVGTLSVMDYGVTLRAVADALRRLGGRLLIYSPLDKEAAGRLDLVADNIVLRGHVDASVLIATLREETDALVIPMALDPAQDLAMRLSFPSKMTDCTAAALPLLIVATDESPVMQWARKHPGSALTLNTREAPRLEAALEKLAGDAALRTALGKAAAVAGRSDFSNEAGRRIFFAALRGGSPADAQTREMVSAN